MSRIGTCLSENRQVVKSAAVENPRSGKVGRRFNKTFRHISIVFHVSAASHSQPDYETLNSSAHHIQPRCRSLNASVTGLRVDLSVSLPDEVEDGRGGQDCFPLHNAMLTKGSPGGNSSAWPQTAAAIDNAQRTNTQDATDGRETSLCSADFWPRYYGVSCRLRRNPQ